MKQTYRQAQQCNLAYSKVLPVIMTVIVVYTTNTEGKVNLQKQLIDKSLGENINIVMMKKVNGHHSYLL